MLYSASTACLRALMSSREQIQHFLSERGTVVRDGAQGKSKKKNGVEDLISSRSLLRARGLFPKKTGAKDVLLVFASEDARGSRANIREAS